MPTCWHWDPDQFMTLAREVGAEYVILTAKHHDGFCLWPTQSQTDRGSSILDLVKMFVTAVRKYSLKVGLYYSWMEFGKSCTQDYLTKIVKPQVRELLTYQPDIWWFEGN